MGCPTLSFQGGTSGIDEALQGLSSDPWQAPQPSSVGLRVPTMQNTPATRYVFLLATRQLRGRTRIKGLRQLLTIGANAATVASGLAERPVEIQVTSPFWRFPDGNVSWHLVLEPNTRTNIQRPLTDAASCMWGESDSPAFLYTTGTTWGVKFVNPTTGAPINYNEGLTAYAPPSDIPARWEQVGGLGCFYDYRFPWVTGSGHNTLDIPLEASSNQRVSLYATILQTSGTTGADFTLPAWAPDGLSPEDGFVAGYGTLSSAISSYYWRVAGDILFDDEDDCDRPCGEVVPMPRKPLPRCV